MPRPSLSTGTGDNGTSGLVNGDRVTKSSLRLHAYGKIDELSAIIGVVLAEPLPGTLVPDLQMIQNDLFVLGSDLATPLGTPARNAIPQATETMIAALEEKAVALERTLPPLTKFILPGGVRAAAELHHARTVCREAERWTVAVLENESINRSVVVYLNRLSDYLFLGARYVNMIAGRTETEWKVEG